MVRDYKHTWFSGNCSALYTPINALGIAAVFISSVFVSFHLSPATASERAKLHNNAPTMQPMRLIYVTLLWQRVSASNATD